MSEEQPRLYDDLASWFHLLTAPADYAAEAAFYRRVLDSSCAPPPRTLLELGSGGGNNASHLKSWYRLTLVDRSPAMLALSRSINPECEHVEGDMRSVRLGRLFDAVFVHDAVMYMTTEDDLRAVMTTAAAHCRPGGAALFVPDRTLENFTAYTTSGGHDGDRRSLRYLEWAGEPDEGGTSYVVDFAYMLREIDGSVRVEHDRHYYGVFPRASWLRLLADAGFQPRALPWEAGGSPQDPQEVFVGVRPDN